jgi:hypothetical protein
MATKYVNRCIVKRNGTSVQHMKNFKMGAAAYRAQLSTSSGQGTVGVQKKSGFSLDYAIPRSNAKLDWSDVIDETWVVELDGGRRAIYTGVDALERGEVTFDWEKESVITIPFAAATETIQ